MQLTMTLSSSASSGSVPSLFSTPGVGAAGIFVTALLAYLLAYLNVVENAERDRPSLRSLLITASVPLSFTFAGIIIYHSLTAIGFR